MTTFDFILVLSIYLVINSVLITIVNILLGFVFIPGKLNKYGGISPYVLNFLSISLISSAFIFLHGDKYIHSVFILYGITLYILLITGFELKGNQLKVILEQAEIDKKSKGLTIDNFINPDKHLDSYNVFIKYSNYVLLIGIILFVITSIYPNLFSYFLFYINIFTTLYTWIENISWLFFIVKFLGGLYAINIIFSGTIALGRILYLVFNQKKENNIINIEKDM